MAKNGNATVQVTFELERETKGAIRMQEVDDKGSPRTDDDSNAVVATCYFRKKQLPNGTIPKAIKATFEYIY